MLHLIPDDGLPHAPTGECGCGPVLVRHRGKPAMEHSRRPTSLGCPSWASDIDPDMGDHVEGSARPPDAAPAH